MVHYCNLASAGFLTRKWSFFPTYQEANSNNYALNRKKHSEKNGFSTLPLPQHDWFDKKIPDYMR